MVAKKPAKKTVKKVVSKAKTPARKRSVTQRSSAKKAAEMQSFRLYKDTQDFGSFRITRQTVYWSILLAVIIVTQLWILKIQMEIAELTNSLLMQ